MRDLYNITKSAQLVEPAVRTSSASAVVMTLDGTFDALNLLFAVGTAGDTLSASVYIQLKLEASLDGTNFAAVKSADLLGATADSDGYVVTVDASGEDGKVYQIGYIGGAKKLKATVAYTGTHSNGTATGLIAVMGDKRFSADFAAPAIA